LLNSSVAVKLARWAGVDGLGSENSRCFSNVVLFSSKDILSMTMMLSSCDKIYVCFTCLILLMFVEHILQNVRLWGLKIFINPKMNINPMKKTASIPTKKFLGQFTIIHVKILANLLILKVRSIRVFTYTNFYSIHKRCDPC
jgi:hypothetical protein